jgi:hypothetical protein
MQPGHAMIQLEHDYLGLVYTLKSKAINPSVLDSSDIYAGSYLQSVTKHLALGIETLYQWAAHDQTKMSLLYLAKLTGSDGKWIVMAQFQPIGVLQTTYWHKLSEKATVNFQYILFPPTSLVVIVIVTVANPCFVTLNVRVNAIGSKIDTDILGKQGEPNSRWLDADSHWQPTLWRTQPATVQAEGVSHSSLPR